MQESHIIIDITESSLGSAGRDWKKDVKGEFDRIQQEVDTSKPNTYSYSTWFLFFLKFGKFLQAKFTGPNLAPQINKILGRDETVGGAHSFGYRFYLELLSAGKKSFSGVQIRTESRGVNTNVDSYQLITYGAPGTGKSFQTKLETEGKTVYRTTFHPDSDYSTFVGAYKPTMSDDAGRIEVYKGSGGSRVLDATQEIKKGIAYDFVPQAFIKAYVDAWTKMNAGGNPPEPVFLVIEEINRGNCAQIFGDLFQLLDRGDDGYSDYPIEADADLQRFLKGQLGTFADIPAEVSSGTKLILPPNLFIRATMNTSDQSLFPIDSAFKRRWDWEYAPIKDEGKDWYVKIRDDKYKWWSFLEKMNKIVFDETQSADKQLGYFFVKLPGEQKEIGLKKFVNKVAFYLWNDVFKDCDIREDALKLKDANGHPGTPIMFTDFFKPHSNEVNEQVVKDLFDALRVEKITQAGTQPVAGE